MTLIIVILVFSALVLIHEAGHLIAAKRSGICVEVFSLGMGKRLFGFMAGGTDYRLSMVPFGGYCQMKGENPEESTGAQDDMCAKPVGYRFWVIAAGSLMNLAFCFLLLTVVFNIGEPIISNEVGEIMNGYPAEKAGLISGDRILSINGNTTEDWNDILKNISSSPKDVPLDVLLERGEEKLNYKIYPQYSSSKDVFGKIIERSVIGIGSTNNFKLEKHGFFQSISKAFKTTVMMVGMTYKMIWMLITGAMPVKGSVAGPIAIVIFMQKAALAGAMQLLILTANISLALAVFNLLPFPALDGGHLLFLLVEKIRKKPLSPKFQESATNVAFMLLITFALFVSWNDIVRFTPIGKMLSKGETQTVNDGKNSE
ncbi:MAG: RIP metalloprotease RseP [Candidatus Omnitrophica bacterium]|nr:RIP metalloprotease RseP [Candidatus Omnitrophota bacterium]